MKKMCVLREESAVIRVLIVAEIGLLSGVLKTVLAREPDLAVSEVDLAADPVGVAKNLRPEVIVVDLGTGGGSALPTVRALVADLPDCAVVALADGQPTGLLRQAIDIEVRGFVSKDRPPEELAEYLRRAALGERVIDPFTGLAALSSARNPLTEREVEVLRLAAEGLPTRLIAKRLYLTEGTVRNHVSAVLRKTGARNRLEAIRRAEQAGWI